MIEKHNPLINSTKNSKKKKNSDDFYNSFEISEKPRLKSDVLDPNDYDPGLSKFLSHINEAESNPSENDIYSNEMYDKINNTLEEINDSNLSKRSGIDKYGTDLTNLAAKGVLDECFGREKELTLLMEILVRRQKNNPVLIGEAGVGKTAIIELLAKRLVENRVPFVLLGRKIFSLDLNKLIAGSKYRGEFEGRFQKVLQEIFANPNLILFIDEIHMISGAGSSEGSMDAANILKPVLARSGFQCIGATTLKEYEIIEKDPALNRRFQPILVKEPSIQETVDILFGLRPILEAFHNVEIPVETIQLSVELASRYIQDRFLPDKAIDVLDRAAAKQVIKATQIENNSIIEAIINSSLLNLGKVRIEAFRRGDLPSAFILQEIEFAYKKFLLQWTLNPLEIGFDRHAFKDSNIEKKHMKGLVQNLQNNFQENPDNFFTILLNISNESENSKYINTLAQLGKVYDNGEFLTRKAVKILKDPQNKKIVGTQSPLGVNLMKKIKLTIIRWVNKLIFSSHINLTVNQDTVPYNLGGRSPQAIYKMLLSTLANDNTFHFSEYRTNLFLLGSWLLAKEKNFLASRKTIERFQTELNEAFILSHFTKYYSTLRSKNHQAVRMLDEDLTKESLYDALSDLEKNRLMVVLDFFENLKPLITEKHLLSLIEGTNLKLDSRELEKIYTILGFYSTDLGKHLLGNMNDPKLISMAKELSNTTILKKKVTTTSIHELISEITNVPTKTLSQSESDKLKNLEGILHRRIIGQEEAVAAIGKAIKRSRLGIQNPNRPIASFLFCGPTGVGKTEVTKTLAETLFGSENEMIRLDMSEFMEKFTLSRLIGSPPGYVGYDEGGQLSDSVRKKPYSVVLFDEVEKAHPDVLNILLQILEDGRLTDSKRRIIPFDNTLIIMTSNAAAEQIQSLVKEYADLNTQKLKLVDTGKESYDDDYAGLIKFLKSPINENFFVDLQKEIRKEFAISTRELYSKKAQLKEHVEGDSKKKNEKNIKQELKNSVLQELKSYFLPEFLNRLDDIIIFQPLKIEELEKICDLMISRLKSRLEGKNINLIVDKAVKIKLTKEGYNPLYGARPLRRLITKYVEDMVSDTLLKYSRDTFKEILTIKLIVDAFGNIVVE